jgi:hypothetical protein
MEGWIKLHRKFTKWEWYQDANTLRLFLHLLLMANHQDGRWQGIQVRRGQHITGRKRLAKDLKLSEKKIRTALNKLKMTNEVTIEPTSMYSMITITNYDAYNNRDLEKANQTASIPANERPTTGQREATNKNVKNVKNEEEIINTPKSSRRKRQKAVPVRDNPPSSQEIIDWCNLQDFDNEYIDPNALWCFYVLDKPEGQQWTYKDGKDVMNWKSLYRNIHNSNKQQRKVVNNNYVQDQTGSNPRTALQDGTRAVPVHLQPRRQGHPDDPIERNEHFAPVEEVVFAEDKTVYVRRGTDWYDKGDKRIHPSGYGEEGESHLDCIKQAIAKA